MASVTKKLRKVTIGTKMGNFSPWSFILLTVIISKTSDSLQILDSRLEIRLHDRHICSLHFPGYISTKGKGTEALKTR